MPFISKERVAEMRKDIKKTFPDFKFSVTREHCSEINVNILAGNIDFGTTKDQVNEYRIGEDYTGEAKTFLKLLADYLTKDQKELVYDGDYGSVPNYYISISIGRWDRPYQLTKQD